MKTELSNLIEEVRSILKKIDDNDPVYMESINRLSEENKDKFMKNVDSMKQAIDHISIKELSDADINETKVGLTLAKMALDCTLGTSETTEESPASLYTEFKEAVEELELLVNKCIEDTNSYYEKMENPGALHDPIFKMLKQMEREKLNDLVKMIDDLKPFLGSAEEFAVGCNHNIHYAKVTLFGINQTIDRMKEENEKNEQ